MYFISRGIERAAMIGCCPGLLAVLTLFTTQWPGSLIRFHWHYPCSVFGFSNGMIIANSTIGATSAAGSHTGTGTGLAGAWQMAAGGSSAP